MSLGLMPAKYWSCPKGCGGRWTRTQQKCATDGCEGRRPKPRTARHARKVRDAARGRRFRLWLGNVPIVSLFSYRWMILQGSVVYDLALTRRAARRRRPNGRAVQVVPVGFPKVWR